MVGTSKLTSTFDELGMDSAFTEQAGLLGLKTLGDVMSVDLTNLKAESSFTYMWYADLLNLLKAHDLLSEFQKLHL